MKKPLLLVLIFLFASFSPIIAQTEKVPNIFINWGATKPMAPEVFNIFWGATFANIGGGVETQLQDNISVFGMFEWHKFRFIRKKGFPVGEVGPAENIAYVSTYSATGNIKYDFDIPQWQTLGGYVYGGGGFIRVLPSLVDFSNKIQWYYTAADELEGLGTEGELMVGRYADDVFKFRDNETWIAQAQKKMLGCAQIGFGLAFQQESGTVTVDVRYMLAFSEEELTAFLPIKVSYWFPIR